VVTLFGGGRIEVVSGKNKLPELFLHMQLHVVIGVLEPSLQCVKQLSFWLLLKNRQKHAFWSVH